MAMNYATTDLYLAACLKTVLNLPLPVIHANGRLSTFVFEVDSIEAQRIAAEFYTDAISVHARRYSQDLRDLKGLLCQLRGARTQ